MPLPRGPMPRSGSGFLRTAFGGIGGASTTSHGPTAKATRYVGSGFVVANVIVFHLPSAEVSSLDLAVLATATSSFGTVSVMSNGVLNAARRNRETHGAR